MLYCKNKNCHLNIKTQQIIKTRLGMKTRIKNNICNVTSLKLMLKI